MKLGSIEVMPMTDFDQVFEINVKSVINMTQLCLPYLIKEKGWNIYVLNGFNLNK